MVKGKYILYTIYVHDIINYWRKYIRRGSHVCFLEYIKMSDNPGFNSFLFTQSPPKAKHAT